MTASCPHAQRWLRSTLHQWLQPRPNSTSRLARWQCRQVSTTSAINRGLRAEQSGVSYADDPGSRRRSTGQTYKKANGGTRGRNSTAARAAPKKAFRRSSLVDEGTSGGWSERPRVLQHVSNDPRGLDRAGARPERSRAAKENIQRRPAKEERPIRQRAGPAIGGRASDRAGSDRAQRSVVRAHFDAKAFTKMPLDLKRAQKSTGHTQTRFPRKGGRDDERMSVHAQTFGAHKRERAGRTESKQKYDAPFEPTSGARQSPNRIFRSPDHHATNKSVRDIEIEAPNSMPVSVPRTTAASTFVYGINAVLAALSAKRRQLYHLYTDRQPRSDGNGNRDKILTLARQHKVKITSNANDKLLDRMSNGRPHNGIALETSQIPALPTISLGKPDLQTASMPIEIDPQSSEDIAVNGAPTTLPILTRTWRQPFILMLDGILDEGNLGNILRTAYFYGVDAVAISKNTCASINSPIVAKASSGAIEAVQILSLPSPSSFVYKSLRASWRIYAAVAPPLRIPSSEVNKWVTHSKVASRSPLEEHPCILMLGAEGEGLRNNLKARADFFVSIGQGDRAEKPGLALPGLGIDSMNVSSAASILVESFMKKPEGAQPLITEGTLGF